MTMLPDNILHLPEYRILGTKMEEHDLHFQVEAPVPVAYKECGVEGEFVGFGKRDVAYRDLSIHGKRVTLWVVRRRYTCRAYGKTFRPALAEMVENQRMTGDFTATSRKKPSTTPTPTLPTPQTSTRRPSARYSGRVSEISG